MKATFDRELFALVSANLDPLIDENTKQANTDRAQLILLNSGRALNDKLAVTFWRGLLQTLTKDGLLDTTLVSYVRQWFERSENVAERDKVTKEAVAYLEVTKKMRHQTAMTAWISILCDLDLEQ